MNGKIGRGWLFETGAAGLLFACLSGASLAADNAPLTVAASEPDIEAIVKEVGGSQVETFVLFRGCILRSHLQVDPAAAPRLLKADAIVWTGFLPEAGAIRLAVGNLPKSPEKETWNPPWINLSKNTEKVDAAVSTAGGYCEGDVNEYTTHGDPFFRLNPENGAVMARDVAKALGKLRPSEKATFQSNAEAFSKKLAGDIARWKRELKSVAGIRIFCTQCGWENFAKLGGPELLVCKKKPGCCPTPEALAQHVKEMKAAVILVDPHTRPNHAKALREMKDVVITDVPSSIGDLPGATSYEAIFDRFVEVLQKCSQEKARKG
jgi:ABC-type Zn uptake system ZnuABC Zn-binding protein ZnuA